MNPSHVRGFRSFLAAPLLAATLALMGAAGLAGCWSPSGSEVVVYAALDREFSEPILEDFQRQARVRVLGKYDVESTKTVGLVTEIIQEQNRPRCDLFWNNEILHTLRLERLGLLEPHRLPEAEQFPSQYRSPTGHWYGFAARARVLIVNTDLVPADQRPGSIEDLGDPRWRGQVAVAKPLFGTTATHAAVLFAHWGPERAEQFFGQLKQNAQVLAGNKQVALAVARGQLAFGLTDTDDAIIEQDQGLPVECIYPDQHEDGMGTLLIPNTLALIKGSRNTGQARQLMEHLLTPEVEQRLAAGRSAQFPLHQQADATSRAQPDPSVRWMAADFHDAADHWDTAYEVLREMFAGG